MTLAVKNPLANSEDRRDTGLIPGSGRSPGEGNSNPLQCSHLEIPRTEEPGKLQSMRSRVRHDLATKTPPPVSRNEGLKQAPGR